MIKVPHSNLSKMMIKLAVEADKTAFTKLEQLDETITKRGLTQLKSKDGDVQLAVFIEQSELNYLRDLYDSPI